MSRVAAVVVNFNARDHLVECVRSLRKAGVEEVVVADNGSCDGSDAALAAADRDARLLPTGGNLGFGRAANRGAASVEEADYLLVCNPDLTVDPDAVDLLAEVLDHDPAVAIVGPRIVDPDGTTYPSPRLFPGLLDAVGHAFLGYVAPRNRFTRRYRLLDVDRDVPAADVDWVSGSCFLVRRRAWDALGGFDERYFMYAEDVDLCWRAHRAGWHVAFEPAARVTHVQGVSTARHPYRMILEHHRSLLRFSARTTTGPGRALLPVVALGLAVRTAVAWGHRLLSGLRNK
ncbi:MAG: glycosyltransferase family 2 protein [Actinomycetota bacterium]|nr:glycosyltransferase family 2 protein [Actinomycetota bacterium]